MYMISEIE